MTGTARRTDPSSSHEAVAAITTNKTLADHIIDNARRWRRHGDGWFTDDDLLSALELATGKRQQRNVIARSRGLLEREGHLVRKEGPLAKGERLSFRYNPTT